ncbi:hypothetical protein Bca52824_025643 [Brassica carinata]|uniref:Uncharacterized protein n=1 Tax=Brassica carinata TaxID=52824 RepID=A0A8X7V756_BRACI|nr:hypothetical protein Bca52824_025643 [Brassica carinata]
MGERFEELQTQLKSSRGDSTVEVEHGDPPASKPPVSNTSLSNLAPSKPSASNPSRSHLAPSNPSASNASPSKPSPRRSKRLDVNFSQADDMDEAIGTQGLEGLSQASFVPGFDPSQTNNDKVASDWWTPMTTVRNYQKWTRGPSKKLQLSDSAMEDDGSPQASLYYLTEEAWQRFTEWSTNPTALRIGPSRIVCAGKWLGNEEMDAMMYIWRETSLALEYRPCCVHERHVLPRIENEYRSVKTGKEATWYPIASSCGEESFHLMGGLIKSGVITGCCIVNIIEKKVEVYDCSRERNRQYVEKFAAMIPRIVKAVGPPKSKLHLSSYSIADMPMQMRLNKSCVDYGHTQTLGLHPSWCRPQFSGRRIMPVVTILYFRVF